MTQLTPELLLNAYAVGIFPMAEARNDPELYWIDPERRGILPLDGFHVPRSLRRTVNRETFEIRIDSAFRAVVAGCAAPAPDRPESWINDEIQAVYGALFDGGHAHSVECWQDGRLAGGLYGVALGGAFFGESMFSRVEDASKVALVHLVARMRLGGFRLLDTQFVTAHLARFGAIEIPREDYRRRLRAALRVRAHFPDAIPADADAVVRLAEGG
jgi:leucyl/phenylalanyl-tRNA--protein transferase